MTHYHRHVIVEGPDGAGKTTLARWLCHRHNMAYHHEGPPPKSVNLLRYYGGLLARASQPTVFDRLHLGELVYGPLLRNRSGITQEELTLMRRLTQGMGAHTVLCLPPFEVCEDHLHTQELLSTVDQRVRAYDAWRTLVGAVDRVYDRTVRDFGPLPLHRALPPHTIGAPTARYLFVGEQTTDPSPLVFFCMENSSGYLHRAVAAAGFTEDEIAFTNALQPDGTPTPLNMIAWELRHVYDYAANDGLRVIALGRVAQARCQMEQIAAYGVPHPQYWKRFHHGRTDVYVEMLRAARDEGTDASPALA